MRKLTVAASLATLAIAAAPATQAADAAIGGVVGSICEINNLDASISNFTAITTGNFVEDTDINIRCNSPGGMNLSMRSLGGGLTGGSGDAIVPYTAELETFDYSGTYLEIDTADSTSASDTVAANDGLALLGETFELLVTLTGDAVYSGTYQDTIRIELSPQ